jgi:hypothetical protein
MSGHPPSAFALAPVDDPLCVCEQSTLGSAMTGVRCAGEAASSLTDLGARMLTRCGPSGVTSASDLGRPCPDTPGVPRVTCSLAFGGKAHQFARKRRGAQKPVERKRLSCLMFFDLRAPICTESTTTPATADKLRRATPHRMRHTHATHALDGGAELKTVRDNLRHASIATTSVYLHGDDVRRAKQMAGVFGVRTK